MGLWDLSFWITYMYITMKHKTPCQLFCLTWCLFNVCKCANIYKQMWLYNFLL